MSTEAGSPESEPHVYPSGVQESHGGAIPIVLKLTYVGFVLFGLLYFFFWRHGSGSALVEEYNRLTGVK